MLVTFCLESETDLSEFLRVCMLPYSFDKPVERMQACGHNCVCSVPISPIKSFLQYRLSDLQGDKHLNKGNMHTHSYNTSSSQGAQL